MILRDWAFPIATLALLLLVSCGPREPDVTGAGRSDTRQIPSNTEPGLHIGGYANVGIRKRL